MLLLKIVIGAFVLLEISNVVVLYFMPDSRLANAMGYFKAWEKSKSDPDVHQMVNYLVNWVAGTKLIFILLLIIFLIRGDAGTLPLVGAAMVVSISSFFWRLFPGIKTIDENDQIEPKGYSKTLLVTILGMVVLFAAGTVLALIS